MLKLLELTDFRGFADARVNGLAKVNLITGVNGSGKTSILEAAFLISGGANASLAASMYGFRGESAWVIGGDRPFRSLFRNLNPALCPRIVASSSELFKTHKRYRRELTIRPTYAVREGQATTKPSTELRGVTFDFTGPSGNFKGQWGWTADLRKILKTKAGQVSQLLGGEPVENPDLIQGQFVSPYVRDVRPSSHELLTTLVKERRIGEVVEVLKLIQPSLKNLQPLSERDDAVVYADVGGEALLPISLLGTGLTNCLHIVLPCIKNENATILIDEFEDGIHHSLLAPLLRTILDIADKRKNQLFITTHSAEFLRHFIAVMKERRGAVSGKEVDASSEQAKDVDVAFFRLPKIGLTGNVPKYSLTEAERLLDSNIDLR